MPVKCNFPGPVHCGRRVTTKYEEVEANWLDPFFALDEQMASRTHCVKIWLRNSAGKVLKGLESDLDRNLKIIDLVRAYRPGILAVMGGEWNDDFKVRGNI
jgi:hypothetical protein